METRDVGSHPYSEPAARDSAMRRRPGRGAGRERGGTVLLCVPRPAGAAAPPAADRDGDGAAAGERFFFVESKEHLICRNREHVLQWRG